MYSFSGAMLVFGFVASPVSKVLSGTYLGLEPMPMPLCRTLPLRPSTLRDLYAYPKA